MKNYTIKQGNNIDTLKEYPDNHFDSIVTDPPYGIEFLGKDWDKNTGAVETWSECFRVLKPGGYLLAFSAARTYHHLATNIEGVGFEIRDQLMWLYSSGFPKAQDIGKAIDKRAGKKDKTVLVAPTYGNNGEKTVSNSPDGQLRCPVCKKTSEQRYHCGQGNDCGMVFKPQTPLAKQWAGWKTALKPAHEPIVMARKPFKGSAVDNVLKHGVGALNIDATRIHTNEKLQHSRTGMNNSGAIGYKNIGEYTAPDNDSKGDMWKQHEQGRFPSNVLGEVKDYQKFFYCPKVNRAERHIGFETDNIPTNPEGIYDIDKGDYIGSKRQQANSVGNNHPTVKPVELMKYLIRLVTPPGGKVLDPFTGSGSTGMACVELGYDFTGCELDENYVNIANARIDAWYEHTQPDTTYNELFEEE